jgi:hypothetical protein
MYIDSLLRVCSSQAFTAVAVSASSIDLGLPGGVGTPTKREVATGEPIGYGLNVNVAASSTTVLVELIQATDAALTAGIIVHSQRTFLSADMPLGALIFMPLPQGAEVAGWLQFQGIRVTPAGGAATVTLSAWLTAHSLFSVLARSYAKNYLT